MPNAQTTFSQFLRNNDNREERSRSNSPYRFNQCPNNYTYQSSSKLQDSFISRNQNIQIENNQAKSTFKGSIQEESIQESSQHENREVSLPLTEFYANKYSSKEKTYQGSAESENQYMVQA